MREAWSHGGPPRMSMSRFSLASFAVLVSLPACNILPLAEDRGTPAEPGVAGINERPSPAEPGHLAEGRPLLDVPGEEWLQDQPAPAPDRLRQDLDLAWEDYRSVYT